MALFRRARSLLLFIVFSNNNDKKQTCEHSLPSLVQTPRPVHRLLLGQFFASSNSRARQHLHDFRPFPKRRYLGTQRVVCRIKDSSPSRSNMHLQENQAQSQSIRFGRVFMITGIHLARLGVFLDKYAFSHIKHCYRAFFFPMTTVPPPARTKADTHFCPLSNLHILFHTQ